MRRKILFVAVTFGILVISGQTFAATDSQNLTVNATVSAIAKLSLTPTTITFPSTDPDTASIPADNAVSVTAKARTSTSGSVALTVQAGGDLTSGSDVIDITNVTWTASGSGYVLGTMNKSSGQSAGSWTGSGNRAGTLNFFLANSWSYATGSYTATAAFTLTAP